MPSDVDAAVISNARLSDDYCVVSLEAPEIAAVAQPGQFVMVKPSRGLDPLLRRPFSIFEVLRDRGRRPGRHLAPEQAHRRRHRPALCRRARRAGGCLGPLGRPFVPVDPPAHAWMVAGGVGLAPFLTLAEALHARGTR